MTMTEAVDSMHALYLAAWVAAGYSAANIRWGDVNGSIPTGGVVWSRVTVKHATGGKRVLSPGANTHENGGSYIVQVFAPIGDGNKKALQAAQVVVDALRQSNISGVWFRNARPREVGVSGAFEQINVLADFSYDN